MVCLRQLPQSFLDSIECRDMADIQHSEDDQVVFQPNDKILS